MIYFCEGIIERYSAVKLISRRLNISKGFKINTAFYMQKEI